MAYLYSRYLIPEFEEYFRSGLVLDLGCGKGALEAIIKTIPEHNFKSEFVGVDISLDMLLMAKSFTDYVVCASAEYLPFKDRTFAAVFSVEVIEHIPKEKGFCVIKEMERVSNGVVAITTPSHFFIQDKFNTSQVGHYMRHESYWSVSEFKRLGYSVEGLHPVREYIPLFLSKKAPYLACSVLAYKVITHDK